MSMIEPELRQSTAHSQASFDVSSVANRSLQHSSDVVIFLFRPHQPVNPAAGLESALGQLEEIPSMTLEDAIPLTGFTQTLAAELADGFEHHVTLTPVSHGQLDQRASH